MNSNKFLSQEETEHLQKLLKKNRHDWAALAIELALLTGARQDEILKLKTSSLNTKSRSVYILGSKGSNNREIPLPSDFFQALFEYASNLDTELMFHKSRMTLRYHWELYRPAKKGMHCLRHTFAVRLFKKTRDIRLVSIALGHKSIENSMIYAKYVYSMEELRSSLEGLQAITI